MAWDFIDGLYCNLFIIILCFVTNRHLLSLIDKEQARLSVIPWVVPWSQAMERW